MRKGKNPFKVNTKIDPPASITVGVLTCIPDTVGYFAGALEVLKLCLASIIHHADHAFDLLVVDNGSGEEVRSYLQEALAAGQIDYLVLNRRNIGRPNGVRQVLRSAPGDWVFYSDGDIYFRPGWMKAHLEIARTFTRVGIVGGIPIRKLGNRHTAATFRWIEQNRDRIKLEQGALIPEAWSIEFAKSVGYANIEALLNDWNTMQDSRITLEGVTAYIGASHMQFLMPRAVVEKLPHRRFDKATGLNPQIMDTVIDEEGFLRLSTARPYVYHIGNRLEEGWIRDEYERLVGGEFSLAKNMDGHTTQSHWFWGRVRVQRFLRAMHAWTFEKYYS